MNFVETIKSRPWLLLGGVAIGAVVLFMARGSGGAVENVDSGTSGDTAGYALQLAGIQTQAQNASLAADVRRDEIAASLEAMKIQAGASENIADKQLSVELAKVNALSQIQLNHDTLAAGVANKNIEAGVESARIASTTTLGTVAAVQAGITTAVNANLESQRIQAGLFSQQISTQGNVAAMHAANARPRSWFESIFG